jgi:cephalosporin hydroxylase
MLNEWVEGLAAEYQREARGNPYLVKERELFEERNRFSFYSDMNPLWLMDHAERAGVVMLLQLVRPKVVIEIGARYAGSTLLFSRAAEKVYVIDIDPALTERCKPLTNVEVRVGDSRKLVGELIRELQVRGQGWDLALVDGDHSAQGVQADLDALLATRPSRPCWISMHDSFNPECREGILAAKWQQPWVHAVEIDFTIGNLMPAPHVFRRMWGGLSLAELRPQDRVGPLEIRQTARLAFEACLRDSYHVTPPVWQRIARKLRRGFHARPVSEPVIQPQPQLGGA